MTVYGLSLLILNRLCRFTLHQRNQYQVEITEKRCNALHQTDFSIVNANNHCVDLVILENQYKYAIKSANIKVPRLTTQLRPPVAKGSGKVDLDSFQNYFPLESLVPLLKYLVYFHL